MAIPNNFCEKQSIQRQAVFLSSFAFARFSFFPSYTFIFSGKISTPGAIMTFKGPSVIIGIRIYKAEL